MITGILAGLSAAVKIGSAVSSHIAQDKQADATEGAVRQALRLKRRDLSIRGIEESRRAAQGRSLADRQAMGASGTARASGAAAGVRGASNDAILGDISGDLARTYNSLDMNLVASLDQIERVRAGVDAEGQARLNSIERPSLFQTVLRSGGALLDAYSSMRGPVGADVSDNGLPRTPQAGTDYYVPEDPDHLLGGR